MKDNSWIVVCVAFRKMHSELEYLVVTPKPKNGEPYTHQLPVHGTGGFDIGFGLGARRGQGGYGHQTHHHRPALQRGPTRRGRGRVFLGQGFGSRGTAQDVQRQDRMAAV